MDSARSTDARAMEMTINDQGFKHVVEYLHGMGEVQKYFELEEVSCSFKYNNSASVLKTTISHNMSFLFRTQLKLTLVWNLFKVELEMFQDI